MTINTKEQVPHDIAEILGEFNPLQQSLLFNRGITSKEDAEAFLSPSYDSLHDPFLMNDMDVAVERILKAVKNNETIAIYSDYDCDGIPGGVLLHDFLKGIGYENFFNYIPHRHEEGYGLNTEAIDTLKEKNTSLVITVDCGITDVDEVEYANTLGIDVILTDHHEQGEKLPPALAVLNPKRNDSTYPFRELCGTGVAYKLITATLKKGKEEGVITLKEGMEKWWLDVVGLATIADMVPLIDENRVLAHYGLYVLKKGKRLGFQHLFRTMKTKPHQINEDDIGFMIAPRINAASRMDNPEDAFRLLTAGDETSAGSYATHLDKINNERKGVVAAMVKDMKSRLKGHSSLGEVILIGNPNWRPALVGLAANALAEEHARPVFVWGRDGRGKIKGSCRSEGKTSVVELMHGVKDVLIEYGGHHFSGGFAVDHDNIHTLGEKLNETYRQLESTETENEDNEPDFVVDADLTIADVHEDTYRYIRSLSPFGEGNPKPLFRFRGVTPHGVEVFGKGKDHTKALFPTERGSLEAVCFFKKPEDFHTQLSEGKEVDLIGHVEKSYFMNRQRLRIRIVEVV